MLDPLSPMLFGSKSPLVEVRISNLLGTLFVALFDHEAGAFTVALYALQYQYLLLIH